MESPQNIKKRLKSVSNIGQITKAMELVSATKMRKSQQIALDSRPYSFAALDFMATISALENQKLPQLFEVRKNIKRVLFVLVSSDKGLAGAFNSSVFKKFELHVKEYTEKRAAKKPDKSPEGHFDPPTSAKLGRVDGPATISPKESLGVEQHLYVAVGEKSFAYLNKKGFKILKKFTNVGDYITPEQVRPLVDFIIDGYLRGGKAGLPSRSLGEGWDRVIIISTHFRSALKQEPHVRRVLPIDYDHIADTIKQIIPERGKFADLIKEHNLNFVPKKNPSTGSGLREYTIEPKPEKVLEKLAEHLFFMQIYHLILEANASEHSARRMAMKTASDNASELGEALNLQYNKSRQSRITTEISEISAGAEALS